MNTPNVQAVNLNGVVIKQSYIGGGWQRGMRRLGHLGEFRFYWQHNKYRGTYKKRANRPSGVARCPTGLVIYHGSSYLLRQPKGWRRAAR